MNKYKQNFILPDFVKLVENYEHVNKLLYISDHGIN